MAEFLIVRTDQHQPILGNWDISIMSAIHFHPYKADSDLSPLKHRMDGSAIAFAKLVANPRSLLQKGWKQLWQNALCRHS